MALAYSGNLDKYITTESEETWEDYWQVENVIIQREFNMEYPYEDCFREAAEENQLPVSLLLAISRGESGFNPRAVSSANAVGMMQILWPITAKDLGFSTKEQLYNACDNIHAGARYIKQLIEKFDNNLHLAVAAYNYGPQGISQQLSRRGKISQGALGYSSYILYHLDKIRKTFSRGDEGAETKKKIFPVERYNLFTSKDWVQTHRIKSALEKHIKGIRLHVFTDRLGLTSLVFVNDDDNQYRRKRMIRDLKKFGYLK
ncbi:MAG: transglycosylase SLT domain-containing protein [Bdellovibrionales bacterium]|nr:transglycosylase SLT domain-containing protein [Bdellovibrionales bacterium]